MAKNYNIFNKIRRRNVSIISLVVIFLSLVIGFNLNTRPIVEPESFLAQTVSQDIDPQTGEFYDLWLNTQVETLPNTGGGPIYFARTKFILGGPRLASFNTLYGIKQRSESPYLPNEINFIFNDSLWGRFTGTLDLYDNNCIDLHSSTTPVRENYIATLCYRNTYVEPGKHIIIYAANGNPLINADYRGSQWTTVQFFSTAFDKYMYQLSTSNPVSTMTRVNWLTLDSNRSSLDDFDNVVYTIQGITGGLNDQQYYQLCNNPTNPQKYIKFTQSGSGPKPDGGENIPVSELSGACAYNLNYHYLKPFFISLYVAGGVPLPSPSPELSPSPSPVLPSPSVSPNNIPVISTSVLKPARLNKNYTAFINGYDIDTQSQLTMTLTNLPPGIKQISCNPRTKANRQVISCLIAGSPSQKGVYKLKAELTDKSGGFTTKYLYLRVN